MKFTSFAALAAVSLAIAAPAVAADNFYLFGFSPSGTQTLTLDSTTIGAPVQSGWFDNAGSHTAGNSNYLTALAPDIGFPETRSFFTFDVGAGVTSASVSIGNAPGNGFYSSTGAPITLTLYDVNSVIDTNLNYSGNTSIFNDLGTGTVFGSVTVFGPTSAVVVNFNAAGIAAINAAGATGSSFTFGGSISTGAVPEPASWAMMIAGFGLVGATMRRRTGAVAA